MIQRIIPKCFAEQTLGIEMTMYGMFLLAKLKLSLSNNYGTIELSRVRVCFLEEKRVCVRLKLKFTNLLFSSLQCYIYIHIKHTIPGLTNDYLKEILWKDFLPCQTYPYWDSDKVAFKVWAWLRLVGKVWLYSNKVLNKAVQTFPPNPANSSVFVDGEEEWDSVSYCQRLLNPSSSSLA